MTLCNGSNECRKIPKFTRSLWGLGIFGSFDFFYQCFIVLLCQKMATMNIQLNKQNVGEPWGFRLQGGQDFRQQLMIKKVSDLQTRGLGGGGQASALHLNMRCLTKVQLGLFPNFLFNFFV